MGTGRVRTAVVQFVTCGIMISRKRDGFSWWGNSRLLSILAEPTVVPLHGQVELIFNHNVSWHINDPEIGVTDPR